MNRFKFLPNDNQSYKELCREGRILYLENKELKKAVRMLQKEKHYWIPLIATCSFISFVSGHNSAKGST